ncbi:MAG: hypothetical protein WCF20_02455 [Methylovirgula sp.]
MINENFRRLRDELNAARQDVKDFTSREYDAAKALELRNVAHKNWQILTTAVRDYGHPVFLTRKLRGDEAWYVHVLWPDGSEEHISSFQSESEVLSWISTNSPEWSKRASKIA